jgi:SAM-dependent methyltransferase/acyl carrier protein
LGEAGNLHRLVEGLGGTITRLGTQHNLKRFTGLRREFDRLTTRYVVETFSRLSWTPEIGTQINAETLGQTLGILPRYQRLLNRLLAMGMEDGLLRGQEGDFIIASWPQPGTAGDLHQELVEKYPGCATELTLAHRCASNMAAVMKGTCDPLHVLFGEDMVQLTERLYEKSPVAGFFNELLAQAVGALVSALPPDRPIRILEVGAGTGGTSAHIAPLLPADRAEYVFSDVSNVFLSRAKEKFAGFSFLQYRLLDLEKDLTEQGFAEGQFDLIVAANVLHATRDIRRSLQQARRLLVPGGLLFLLEGTQRHRLLDIIFGLTEGWWQFTDTDLRPDYPLLSPQEWLEVLGRENFEALQVPAGFDEQSVLIARTAARELRSAGAPSTAALGTILPTVTTVGGSAEGKDTQGPPTFASSGFRWLDLDPDYPPETQRSILAEALNHCDNETVASYRGDQRYVPRLKPGAGITIEPGEVVALGLPGQGHVWIRPAAGDPFFSELSRQEKPPKTESPGLAGQTLLALPAADRSKALEKFLRSEFAEITGLELTDADLDKPLHSFGLDSLMAIQLRNRVEAELKISLSLVDFLKGLSLSQIVHNANQELAGPQTSEVSTPLAVPENSLGVLKAESVENLSEKDLDRFLQSLLEAERAPALPNSGAPHLTELP